MASSVMPVILSFLFLVLCHPYAAVSSAGQAPCCYKRLFSLGDSIIDNGNLGAVNPNISALAFPYGETFFHHPTGRFCDGRVIVDFIAEALRLPFLTPFLAGKTAEDFEHGANFAVAGATALSQQFFKDMGLDLTIIPPFSLDVQVEWFKRVLCMLGPTEQERMEIMSSSLFLLGEIGGNDYNHPFFQNRSFSTEIKPLVPKVIEKIENATKVLIGLGAKTIVVPGNFPVGCIPRYLTMFQSNNSSQYDAAGCIKWLNDFSEEHNNALRRMLKRVASSDPTVTIIYGDYYGAVLEITRSPQKHGFRKDVALTACCGDGGPHNSGTLFSCNATSVLCPDPSTHISWDGLHLTEATYQFVARGMLDGPYAVPSILSKCRH
ncbi:hypothetical protein HU200_016565 [Digitaria exilis]|uniref:Uncharacterized protein n=1 Tax=Digitaria exilis TaxID=1010633 RepID=A0A835KJF5_9POAL|nr:hypothetical protein HU200_016565 [Digitaria exilis]